MKAKIRYFIFLAIVVSFTASYFFPGVGSDSMVQSFITFIGILFGIIVGFFIADLYARYQAIRTNAAEDSSDLSTFYLFATILTRQTKDRAWLKRVKERIYNYVRKFMPLPWERYSETEEEFSDLGKSLDEIKYSGEKANETYSNLLRLYNSHSTSREKLVMFGKDKLSWGEWLITLFLGGLLLASIFYVKTSSLTSIIFTGAITSAVVILFIVLRDLNNLNFGENAVSVEPYERVLDAIGRPRYFRDKGNRAI